MDNLTLIIVVLSCVIVPVLVVLTYKKSKKKE
jgi:preprotein translocase subunit SecG